MILGNILQPKVEIQLFIEFYFIRLQGLLVECAVRSKQRWFLLRGGYQKDNKNGKYSRGESQPCLPFFGHFRFFSNVRWKKFSPGFVLLQCLLSDGADLPDFPGGQIFSFVIQCRDDPLGQGIVVWFPVIH